MTPFVKVFDHKKGKMLEEVKEAAKREHEAESARDQLEASWRAAWWQTTLTLARVEGKSQVAEARRIVQEETGQSTRYIWHRQATGRATALEHTDTSRLLTELEILPPRLSMELVRAGYSIDADAKERLLEAERTGVSLREFAQQLGTQPEAWQSQEQRRAAQELPGTPEDKARAILDEIQNPGVTDAIAQQDRGDFIRAANRVSEQQQDTADREHREYIDHSAHDFIHGLNQITKAKYASGRGLQLLYQVELDDDQRELVRRSIQQVRLRLDWIESYIDSSSKATDQELSELLESE